ncbi:MAG: Type IIS restriction enzyme Eco57I [Bacteroidetes bacterium ADurb.Bin234]|nr:MAG: Type IIS restriction enzyme Eco57I [Bacteroidetes bacterium ADurb.Bin234]
MDKISFPEDYTYSTDPTKDKEIRNATNLIRLITRIIFIWFLKEKDLVPSYLFSKEKLAKLVLDFVKDKKSYNFYNAILQNLFFATLNQKMNERKFTEDNGYPANKKEYGVKNLYRYADKLLIDKDKVLELFQDIPFLNGGLFDCLDKEDETGKVIYIDGFSRNIKKQANIPDYLFFQEGEERVDLSSYGIVSKPVRGLIDILNSYNFTIDENTPIDQEIALDPELLGKVFENLLASYNPETATTARKATGSYYTPREIVDYMVEASLFEYLKGKFPEIEEEKIKLLFSYSEEISEFSEEEKQKIITAIDEIKILDPACGSGAFPMGILHKLVFTLQKLDPENKHWYDLQYQKALKETEEVFKQGDKTQREERLKEINETFDENINYPDYARKLFLIENCIYGVDIQPIAIQISKLRFFISLVLDQKVDKEKENFGIRALPNLETKFVAANTLIGLNKPDHLFYTDSIKSLEDEIKALRHKYFTAKSRREKLEYQRNDRELREQLSQALKSIGFSSDSSEKIAKFDIYDQNASADWFDSEWMFGVTDGFDIVIGNPPYIDSETMVNIGLEDLRNYLINNLKFTRGNWDIYIAFFEVGFYLLNQSGIITFITPDKWISKPFGYELRKNLLSNYWIITESGRNVFESSNIDSIITFITKSEKDNISINKFTDKTVVKITDASKNSIVEPFTFDWLFSKHIQILNKIESLKSKLSDYGICENACATSDAYKLKTFIINVSEKTYSADKFLKVINTGTIDKYTNKWGKIEMTYLGNKYLFPAVERDKFLKEFTNTYGRKSIKQKIIIKGLTLLDACFDFNGSIIPGKSTLIITSLNEKNLKFLLGLLNSKLAIFYIKEKYRSSSYNQGINFNKGMINSFPIPQVTNTELTTIIALVDQILSAKERGEDTIALEREIDKLVYKLYDLTEEEIRIIENRK